MRRDMKRTDRRKYRNREADRGTRGSMNCHFRHFRMSWSRNSTTPTRPSERCVTWPDAVKPLGRRNEMDHGGYGTSGFLFIDASHNPLRLAQGAVARSGLLD